MSRRIERVVIVGYDAAAWLSALTLARALGRTGLGVHVVELGSMVHPVDVYPALPTLEGMHELLGLEEMDLLAASSGVLTYGQRFANWSRSQAPFLHTYDTVGAAANNVEFLHFWLRARAEGMNVALEDFSLGAASAKQGRYVMTSEESAKFSKAAYGYHLDAMGYVRAIRKLALKLGVTMQQTQVGEVKRNGERIVSLALTDGTSVEADLFVDASGQKAVLIGAVQGAEFEPWRAWFGCDRIMSASAKRLTPLPAFAEIAAFKAGWLGTYPLQNRTGLLAVYDSSLVDDRAMAQQIAVLSGLSLEGEAVASDLTVGVRKRAWAGNCVAVGEAAVCLEPLDAAPLQIVQACVSHLVSLFPVDADSMPEAGLYNAGVTAHAVNLRDFQIAHYKLNKRVDEPFWDRAREMAIPDSLAYKINLFATRGRVALYDDEAFQEPSWMQSFIGHGLMPRAYDPLADAVSSDELIGRFRTMLSFIAAEVQDMPSLAAHLEMMMPAGSGR